MIFHLVDDFSFSVARDRDLVPKSQLWISSLREKQRIKATEEASDTAVDPEETEMDENDSSSLVQADGHMCVQCSVWHHKTHRGGISGGYISVSKRQSMYNVVAGLVPVK